MTENRGEKKVLVAMSGGVDSSVCALLLKERGFEVTGLSLKLWVDEAAAPPGYLEAALKEAEAAARALKVKHLVVDASKRFLDLVVDDFKASYTRGRTPNPCVLCNPEVKFALLLEEALKKKISYVATGHYARVLKDEETGLYQLKKAVDKNKDQSYMLYRLGQKELAKTLFPLGDLLKDEVKKIAEEAGIPGSSRPESQEICFIPDNDYRSFLKRTGAIKESKGHITALNGQILGEHQGIFNFTVGQRKGLGLAAPRPLYVCRLNSEKNEVVVGEEKDLYSKGLWAEKMSFVAGFAPQDQQNVGVKIRYRAEPVPALFLSEEEGRGKIIFSEAQRAVTPGQAAVLYQGDEVIGGGIISGPLEDQESL